MATVTSAGEILTLTTIPEEQRDGSPNPAEGTLLNSSKKYVRYNPSDKKTTIEIPRVLGEAERGDHEQKSDGMARATALAIDDIPFDSDFSDSEDTENDDMDNGGGDDDNNGVHESPQASPVDKSDDESMLSDSTPINFHNGTIRCNSNGKNDDGSVLSDTTPIKFHETSVTFNVDERSSAGGSVESAATPIRFRQSTTRSVDFLVEESHQSDSEFYDQAIDEEREIINVKLNASAFSDKERINLTEDIYSFILACSWRSMEFWCAIYFILVKYLCYGVLISEIDLTTYKGETLLLITKFIMIPLSVCMQEDLITVYYNVANKKYDALTYKRNRHATENKWILCNLLRMIDGLLSVIVNFTMLMMGEEILNMFLSFAALHFLEFIDDVIYELAEKGFFGSRMEQATVACKIITFTRRTTTGNKCNNFITNLDTVLLIGTSIILYLAHSTIIVLYYTGVFGDRQ